MGRYREEFLNQALLAVELAGWGRSVAGRLGWVKVRVVSSWELLDGEGVWLGGRDGGEVRVVSSSH